VSPEGVCIAKFKHKQNDLHHPKGTSLRFFAALLSNLRANLSRLARCNMLLLTFLCSIRYWLVLEAACQISWSSSVICYDKSCEFSGESGKPLCFEHWCILHRLFVGLMPCLFFYVLLHSSNISHSNCWSRKFLPVLCYLTCQHECS